MQLEFTYQLADIRESLMPERFAAHPERYARRWIRPALLVTIAALVVYADMWLLRLLPEPWARLTEKVPHDLRTELLPALIPAFYVCATQMIFIWKGWRSAWEPMGPAPAEGLWVRAIRMAIGFICGIGMWAAMSPSWDPIWYPTRRQLVLAAMSPWLVVIVLMVVTGALRQRVRIRGDWFKNPGLRRHRTVILGETGFQVRDALCRFEFTWAYFTRVRETKNLLVIAGEGGTQYVIPKRAFASAADLERCRSLLQNVVPNTRFLVKPVGFAVMPNPVLPLPEIATAVPGSVSLTEPQDAGTMQPANETELQQ